MQHGGLTHHLLVFTLKNYCSERHLIEYIIFFVRRLLIASNWNTPQYYEGHPYLTAEAAEYLKDCQVKLVGIDSHNIDDTSGKTRPVHTILLGAGILIVEHLCNLDQVPENGYLFNAVPPKFKGAGTFPVRAYAVIKKGN